MMNPAFGAKDLLYVGLQGLHDYQQKFLDDAGVDYSVQTEAFVSDEVILDFLSRHPRVFVHLDIDVLDPAFFHDTYFANPALVGDGSGGGWSDNNQVIDGETNYRDVLEQYYDLAMEYINSGEEIPPEIKEFIENYFNSL